MSTVTLLIPIHDPNQEYKPLVHCALDSVSTQSRQPDEVLLVANHELGYLGALQDSFSQTLKIRFLKSDAQSAPENINFGVSQAKCRFIRLLFQDDQLSHSESLNQSIAPLESPEFNWSVIGSAQIDTISGEILSFLKPSLTEKLSSGENLIGAPSVVCFERESYVSMDKDLKFMFDCDWYLRMAHRLGPPAEVQRFGVYIGIHAGQATNWAKNLFAVEKRIVEKTHRRKFLAKHCSCVTSK